MHVRLVRVSCSLPRAYSSRFACALQMFALLGKELFGGKGLAAASRFHFDQPLPALLTVMTIFTGEVTHAH